MSLTWTGEGGGSRCHPRKFKATQIRPEDVSATACWHLPHFLDLLYFLNVRSIIVSKDRNDECGLNSRLIFCMCMMVAARNILQQPITPQPCTFLLVNLNWLTPSVDHPVSNS